VSAIRLDRFESENIVWICSYARKRKRVKVKILVKGFLLKCDEKLRKSVGLE